MSGGGFRLTNFYKVLMALHTLGKLGEVPWVPTGRVAKAEHSLGLGTSHLLIYYSGV